MISAEERRARFLNEKSEAGGAENLISSKSSYYIYFNEVGDIVYFGKNPVEKKQGWLTANFSSDDLEWLADQEVSRYFIYKSTDGTYHIKDRLSDQASWYHSAYNYNVIEVNDTNDNADVTVQITSNRTIDFFLSDTVHSQIIELHDYACEVAGTDQFVFYITAYKDPHILYRIEIVPVKELYDSGVVTRAIPDVDLSNCSVYTKQELKTYTLKHATH